MSVFVVLCADDSGPVPVHDMTFPFTVVGYGWSGAFLLCLSFYCLCLCPSGILFGVLFSVWWSSSPPDVCFMTRWTRYFAFFFFFSFLLFCPWNALVSVAGLYVGPGPSCQIWHVVHVSITSADKMHHTCHLVTLLKMSRQEVLTKEKQIYEKEDITTTVELRNNTPLGSLRCDKIQASILTILEIYCIWNEFHLNENKLEASHCEKNVFSFKFLTGNPWASQPGFSSV